MLGFLGLLVLFATLVVCRDYTPEQAVEEDLPLGLQGEQFKQKNSFMKNLVCPNKTYILMGLGVMFLSMIFARFFYRFKDRAEKK